MSPHRHEFTDFDWSIIAPLLPNKPRGVPSADDRKGLNGIFWRLRTGSPWADIPGALRPAQPAVTALSGGERVKARRMGPPLRGSLAGL
jgi:transposase